MTINIPYDDKSQKISIDENKDGNKEKNKEDNTTVQSESSNQITEKSGINSSDKKAFYEQDWFIVIIILLLPFIIGIFVPCMIFYKEKKSPEMKNLVKVSRYLEIGFYFFSIVFFEEISIFMGIGSSSWQYIIVCLLFSFVCAVLFSCSISVIRRNVDQLCASTKIKMDNRLYYCFEVKDDLLVLGDKKYLCDCTEHRLIPLEDLKDKIFTLAETEEDIYLKKEKVVFDKIKNEDRELALYSVVMHYREHEEAELPSDDVVYIKDDGNSYKYKIGTLSKNVKKEDYINREWKYSITLGD